MYVVAVTDVSIPDCPTPRNLEFESVIKIQDWFKNYGDDVFQVHRIWEVKRTVQFRKVPPKGVAHYELA